MRLLASATELRDVLRASASASLLLPLGSLRAHGRLCESFVVTPIGWEGDAKGKEIKKLITALVARFVEPLLDDGALGSVLARRVRLWLPAALIPGELDALSTNCIGTLRGASNAARVAATRFCVIVGT